MEEFTLLTPLLLGIGGLIIGAVLKSALKHSRFPYTVGLFIIGLVVGLINRTGGFSFSPHLTEAVNTVTDINPDFILYVFLPVLIFDAAYELNLHIFRKTLANAALLAVPGLIICMLLTGAFIVGMGQVIPGLEEWNWTFALMFGALISATDPVAVVALLHELKTSKRFSTLVDAESLLNDGTGIVCFMLFFGTFTASGAHTASPFAEFIQVVVGSTLLGFLMARSVIWFITRINSEEMIQNSAIILSAYLTFILSQYTLEISGVIALVAFGLTVTYTGKPRFKPQVNAFMERFWELMTYMANTLIFLIVGVVIAGKVDFTWQQLGILILIYIALNLFRLLMIMVLYPLMKRMGYGLSRRESVILTWGGLRGALGMTLALMVSYTPGIPEEIRSQILFFTAGIVTLTLSINATTMRWLLNRLGLIHVPSARTLLDTGIITQTVFRRLMNSLDELYDHDGNYPLSRRDSIFSFCRRTHILYSMQKITPIRQWVSFYFRERIMIIHDLGRGFIILQKEDLKLLDELSHSDLLTNEQKTGLETLKEEVRLNITTMNTLIQKLATDFPGAYRHALTHKAIRMLLSNEKRTIRQMQGGGVVSEKDAEPLLNNVDERSDKVNSFSHTIPASILRWMFFPKRKHF